MPTAATPDNHTPKQAPARRRVATVVSNRYICREHYWLKLHIGADQRWQPSRPGQFVQLGARQPDQAERDQERVIEHDWQPGATFTPGDADLCQPTALLRRPFSLAGRRDDATGSTFDIVHRVVGVATDWLSRLQAGDEVDLLGPLGNTFVLPAEKCLGLMVGGGVGLPPMFYLAQALTQAGWHGVGFVGAMSRDLLAVDFDDDIAPDPTGLPNLAVTQFAAHNLPSVVTTDDGSLGMTGRITDGLSQVLDGLSDEKKQQAVVFTCGPWPMMRAVADLARSHGVDCQVCLEQAMACGMGTCQSCIVSTNADATETPHGRLDDGTAWRYRLACTDGPVFDATQVTWDRPPHV